MSKDCVSASDAWVLSTGVCGMAKSPTLERGNVRGVSRCLLGGRAGIKLAQATCREQRAIAFALSSWHAAEAARLRSAIERVDCENGIAPARELRAQCTVAGNRLKRHGGSTLDA